MTYWLNTIPAQLLLLAIFLVFWIPLSTIAINLVFN
jgi:hypothetical protein